MVRRCGVTLDCCAKDKAWWTREIDLITNAEGYLLSSQHAYSVPNFHW